MKISEVLTPELTICCAPGNSKKRVIEYLASFMAAGQPELNADGLYEQLLDRERLGSTGIGDGVAIPHCRSKEAKQVTAAMLKLGEAVNFDAIDDQPVDLVFALVVPDAQCDQHLQTLSSIASVLMEESSRAALRASADSAQLYKTLIQLEH